MYLKGENVAKSYSTDKTVSVFVPWSEERVWDATEETYISGSEYEKRYGMPRRKYVYHDGKMMLEVEREKVAPKDKRINLLLGAKNYNPATYIKQDFSASGKLRVTEEKVAKVIYK